MLILHTSDLHLGKKLNGYDLIEEQRIKLEQIVNYIQEKLIRVVILAGDIFDTSLATDDAIKLFNNFLKELASISNLDIFVIAGNHDSRTRLGNKRVYDSLNDHVHFATSIEDIEKIRIDDVNFFPIPFLKLDEINFYYNEKYNTLTEAYDRVIKELNLDITEKNICIAHQAVNPILGNYVASDSEVKQIGGEDIIPASVFKDFNYVALGHIHMPQAIARNIYYSGSIYKYHHNESSQSRSFLVIDTSDFKIEKINYKLLHDVVVKRDYYEKLLEESSSDYCYFKLLDKKQILNAADGLKTKYENFLGLMYESEMNDDEENDLSIDVDDKSYLDLFKEFYYKIKNKNMTSIEEEIIKKMFEEENK